MWVCLDFLCDSGRLYVYIQAPAPCYFICNELCPFAQTLASRKSFPVSTSVYITKTLRSLPSVSSCGCRALCTPPSELSGAMSSLFLCKCGCCFLAQRWHSLSLTALTADFTSNLLSLSSTAESCKCHYHFCHHNHHLKHQLLPFLQLLFKANDVAVDAPMEALSVEYWRLWALGGQFTSKRCQRSQEKDHLMPPTHHGGGVDISHKIGNDALLPHPKWIFVPTLGVLAKCLIEKNNLCLRTSCFLLKKEIVVDFGKLFFFTVIRLFAEDN